MGTLQAKGCCSPPAGSHIDEGTEGIAFPIPPLQEAPLPGFGRRQKCQLLAMTNSAALRADAAESALCAYLSWIALLGIGLNAIWHIGWADAAAALIIVPLIVREGFQSMRRRACGCC